MTVNLGLAGFLTSKKAGQFGHRPDKGAQPGSHSFGDTLKDLATIRRPSASPQAKPDGRETGAIDAAAWVQPDRPVARELGFGLPAFPDAAEEAPDEESLAQPVLQATEPIEDSGPTLPLPAVPPTPGQADADVTEPLRAMADATEPEGDATNGDDARPAPAATAQPREQSGAKESAPSTRATPDTRTAPVADEDSARSTLAMLDGKAAPAANDGGMEDSAHSPAPAADDGVEVAARQQASTRPEPQWWGVSRQMRGDPVPDSRGATNGSAAPAAVAGPEAKATRPAASQPAPVPARGAALAADSRVSANAAGNERSAPGIQHQADPRVDSMPADGKAARNQPAADPLSARVNVLGFSAAPAPAANPVQALGPTAAGLVEAIEAEPTWRAAAEAAGPQRGQAVQQGTNTLRIQLNPAELGMVTARLSVSGPQLSIEIQTESSDARHKLAGDSDAIVKALRAIGFDIDKVTIQQVPQGASTASPQGGNAGREPSWNGQQQPQDRAGANNGGGGHPSGRQGEGARHGQGEAGANSAGGGVYI